MMPVLAAQASVKTLGIGLSYACCDRDGKGRCAGQRGEGCRQRDQLAMSNWSTSNCYRPAHALACRLVHARSSSAMTLRLISKGSSGDLVCCQHSTLTGPRCARSFPMNAVRKRGRQLASIKGVMLLALDAKSYCRHMAHHAFQSKVNSGTKTPDYRHELTQLVEERVRQEMQLYLSATRFRVLRWEQVDLRNRYVVGFANSMAFSRLATERP